MLTENDVIDAVCKYLEANGYEIQQRATTRERGPDILAVRKSPDVTLYVEAKGETSNKPSSRRFGKPFDSAQCKDHVTNAFYSAAAALSAQREGVTTRAGIALPETKRHRACIARIQAALDGLEIGVFWVSRSRQVCLAAKWKL